MSGVLGVHMRVCDDRASNVSPQVHAWRGGVKGIARGLGSALGASKAA